MSNIQSTSGSAHAATSSSEVDDSFLLQFLQDIKAMDRSLVSECDNAVFPDTFTPNTSAAENSTHKTKKREYKKKKKTAPTPTNIESAIGQQNGWIVKQVNDAPVISWTDFTHGFQYNVQNLRNRGKYLLKLQLFEGGSMKHSSGIYIDQESSRDVFNSVIHLISLLENLWIDRQTGVPKCDDVIRSMMPLAAWRQGTYSYEQPSVPTKRKKAAAAGKPSSQRQQHH